MENRHFLNYLREFLPGVESLYEGGGGYTDSNILELSPAGLVNEFFLLAFENQEMRFQ